MEYATLGDTVYFGFAANTTAGTAGDGASPTFAVRKAGAASSAAPVLTGTPTLLSNASYSDGSHEIAVAATVGNGFEADATYLVFCSLTISTVTPNGYCGKFKLSPVRANDSSGNAIAPASATTAILAIFTGITSLAQWLGLIAGKQVGNTTARTELRATGAGSGTFDETTDSTQAIADAVAGTAAPTVEEIDSQLSATHGSGTWGGVTISGSVSQSSIANGGVLTLKRGDSYATADSRQKTFTIGGIPGDWSAGSAKLWLQGRVADVVDVAAVSFSQSGSTITATFDITSTDIDGLPVGDNWTWEIKITLGTTRLNTPIEGRLVVESAIPTT